MSEHAPGPWTIEPREVTALLLSKDGTHLANIFANDNRILQPQSKWANARLIAAAPEMADEITALRAENEKLRAALDLYREAVRIDATMEGPKFMGSNASALKRAWDADRAALEGK